MRRIQVLLTGIGLCALATPVQADTLQEALLGAYRGNPTLTGARAGLRAIDEGVPLARAQGMPRLSGSGGYTENVRQEARRGLLSPTADRQINAGINAELPLFQGGAVRHAVQAAERRVEAGRADLRATEAGVFTNVVSAYMDVIRDQSLVDLNRNNVDVLATNLRATSDRFEVGDLTRTDVAQSDARLAIARSQLESAEAQLIAARENYLAVVGAQPDDLQPPPPLPGLPLDAVTALDTAMAENPDLVASQRSAEAARRDIGIAKAQRLPRLSAVAGGNYNDYLNSFGGAQAASFDQRSTSATLGVSATVPFYQGGEPGARVRQAQARASQALEQIVFVERSVVAQVRSAFARYQATQAVILSSQAAVSASTLALEGVRAENMVGTRDILDVLNAEQELLSARSQLVTARRDAYVAGFTLLAAMGRAEARDLNLDGGALYDPVLNYRRVRGSIGDWSSDGQPSTQATRTYGPAAP